MSSQILIFSELFLQINSWLHFICFQRHQAVFGQKKNALPHYQTGHTIGLKCGRAYSSPGGVLSELSVLVGNLMSSPRCPLVGGFTGLVGRI